MSETCPDNRIYENESISQLICCEGETEASNYCFDEAWVTWLLEEGKLNLEGLNIDTSKVSEAIEGDLTSIAYACIAVQVGKKLGARKIVGVTDVTETRKEYKYGYTSDNCSVLRNMYGELFEKKGEKFNCYHGKKCPHKSHCEKYSKDWMTNYSYAVRIIINLFPVEDKDKIGSLQNLLDLANRGYGGRSLPLDTYMFSSGFDELSKLCNSYPKLIETLNTFAQRSSQLGNYGCIPVKLYGAGLCGLNVPKGNGSLFVCDKEGNEYLVNDQFALFLEWLNVASHGNREDQKMLKKWKAAMLIKCCEKYYKIAAGHYKMAFKSLDIEKRLYHVTEYLENVNRAIETRSNEIVKVLRKEKTTN